MKKLNSKKGITLIELLIVIAIIAVLAVAFLPTILNAPAKGRDTARVAALQKLQKVLISNNLVNGTAYPADALSNAITGLSKSDFGGAFPVDPKSTWANYYYDKDISDGTNTYPFGLLAMMETKEAANAQCKATIGAAGITKIEFKKLLKDSTTTLAGDVSSTVDTDACFVILSQ
jgi:prepilin-type N-terminal cleavage/methylation domain-containing protein